MNEDESNEITGETAESCDAIATAGRYTVPCPPPAKRQKPRFSRWEESFEECRHAEGEWRRISAPMKKSTASQLASDIRNAHRREVPKSRLKGLQKNERWDAQWGEIDGEFYVWVRFEGRAAA